MSNPILVIRKKMTLTAAEQKSVVLGTVQEKQTATYKKAKTYFESLVKMYSEIGTVSITETKLWFDVSEHAVKMQITMTAIDEKKYQKFSKEMDKAMGKMSQDLDVIFKEMSEHMDKVFKKLEPIMDDAFKKFDEIFDNFFGKGTSKK